MVALVADSLWLQLLLDAWHALIAIGVGWIVWDLTKRPR
jgi:hypothetical protein